MYLRVLCVFAASLAALPLAAADWTWTYIDASAPRVASTIAEDGSTVLVTNGEVDTHFVTRLDPAGNLLWRTEHPLRLRPGDVNMSAGTALVCLRGIDFAISEFHAACYRLQDGSRTWARELSANGDSEAHEIDWVATVLTDDSLLVTFAENALSSSNPLYDPFQMTVRHVRISSTGATLHDVRLPTERLNGAAMRANGWTVFDAAQSSHELESRRPQNCRDYYTREIPACQSYRYDVAPEYVVVDSSGTVLHRVTASELDLTDTTAALAPSGDLYVTGLFRTFDAGEPALHVVRVNTAGTVTREDLGRDIPGLDASYPSRSRLFAGTFAFHGSDVYLAFDIELNSRSYGNLLRLGAPGWRRANGSAYLAYNARTVLVFDPATGQPFVFEDRASRIGLHALDPASGTVLRSRYLPALCSSLCSARVGQVAADGTLRLLAVSGSNATTRRHRVYALDDAFAAPAAARVDQAGLRGAWYATYAPGQGFVFDYFAGSRTVFAPWFTFNAGSPVGAEGLRWYSLQGDVPAGATRASLDILENAGGAFASGPETTPRRVGTATLEMHDCSFASLSYSFDAGTTGVVTLTRLTPATDDCVLADGRTQAVAALASSGFDARHSGAWYVPAQSGQGLMFTVQPRGLFFGAWFTYDRDGASDDASRHHWFSLQADLAAASNGTVVAPIFRSTGGVLDILPATTTRRVGEATVRFTGCDRATLDYAFDDSDAAGAFSTRTGSLALEKIGGCTD